jgi:hypothetical protein
LKNVSSGSTISPCTAQKKASCKNVFLSSNPPSSKLEPMLIYMAVDVSVLFTVFLVLENAGECTLFKNSKSVMKVEHKHQYTCSKTFFYTTHGISFSHNYHTE